MIKISSHAHFLDKSSKNGGNYFLCYKYYNINKIGLKKNVNKHFFKNNFKIQIFKIK